MLGDDRRGSLGGALGREGSGSLVLARGAPAACSCRSRAGRSTAPGLARLLLDVGPGDEAELLDERGQARGADLEAPAAHDVLDGLGERARRSASAAAGSRASARKRTARTSSGTRVDVAVDRRDVGVADAHEDVELFAAAEERPEDEHLGEDDAER